MHYVFDIEGNGLGELERKKKNKQFVIHKECTKVHLLVLRRLSDDKVFIYRNNSQEDTIAQGWARLKRAKTVIGHNIYLYDLPVMRRLYGGDIEGKAWDTLVSSRMLYPDAGAHPFGGNGLKEWGIKLGCHKGDYDGGWDEWSQEMEDYCVQDTLVGLKIFEAVKPKVAKLRTAHRIEQRVADIIGRQVENGVSINIPAAEEMVEFMHLERAAAEDVLQQMLPVQHSLRVLKSRYWQDPDTGTLYETKKSAPADRRKALVEAPWHKMRIEEQVFNPNSTQQIVSRFEEKYGWEAPLVKRKGGNETPGVTEEILLGLDFPEAKPLLKWQMANKRLDHLSDWIERARECRTPGRIHPSINPCGTATSRGSHSQPNQTACPKVHSGKDGPVLGFEGRYGFEMRSLWGPRPGWKMVGGDGSGLQLRMLGNLLARWDGGAYAKEVVEGDIHTLNQNAGDLQTRDQSKTTIYAYLFGAGDDKVGRTIADHPSLNAKQRKLYGGRSRAAIGKKFRSTFQSRIPALAQAQSWCRQAANQAGYLTLLDGFRAPIRSAHSALCSKLQGDEARVMKLAMCLLVQRLESEDILWTYAAPMLWAHDEFQWEAHPDYAERVGEAIVWSIVEAGVRLKLKCPLDADYKIGDSWAETH
jgi:DNA polymerase-1